MNIAILGLADIARDSIPFGVEDWEIWGMPWSSDWVRCDRLFDPHTPEDLERAHGDNYLVKLMDVDVPLYMQDEYIENATRYPIEDVESDYLASTIGYMLSMAISENPEKISLHGVTMADDSEYAYQRPNAEYLIGLARGKGIEVIIPDDCSLLKYNGQFGYVGRYGVRA